MGKLKLGIAGLSDVALEGKARTCHDMCTGNVSFNFPDGLLDRLKTACDQVAQMNDQVRFYGGLIPFQEKRQAVADLRAKAMGVAARPRWPLDEARALAQPVHKTAGRKGAKA